LSRDSSLAQAVLIEVNNLSYFGAIARYHFDTAAFGLPKII